MKNWIKKIGQNKFQFFFFIGMVSVLVVAIIISATLENTTNEPTPEDPPITITPPTDEPVDTIPEEMLKLPFNDNLDYSIVRKFYDKNSSKEEQLKSLIKYGNSYRTSSGTSYAKKDNTSFEVLASLSGKVIEIKDSPLYGNYVVLEHNDKVKTYYYGLSEVCVQVGSTVKQGDKLGVSGLTEIDKEAGNHVYFLVKVQDKYINPETLVGKKISEL